MPTVTVLDDEDMSLWYHPEAGIVHHRIKRYLVQGGFRKLLEASAEQLELHGAARYLSEDRNNVVVDPEDIKWAEDHWYPRALKAGLKRWALVLPATTVGTLQARSILEDRRKRGLEVEGFETVEAAMAWLKEK